MQKYQQISQFGRFSTTKLVKINPLSTGINSNGNLEVNLVTNEYLPEGCQNLEFKTETFHYIDDQNYYYYGTLVQEGGCSCKCQSGEMMLEAREGLQYGYFRADAVQYEILALDTTYSVMGITESTFFDSLQECVATHEVEHLKGPSKIPVEDRTNAGNCVIRVLFLYTPAAATKYGLTQITNMAILGVRQTNQALSNSAVNNVSVSVANIRPLPGFVENSTNIRGDVIPW